jgi:hypothetical protein
MRKRNPIVYAGLVILVIVLAIGLLLPSFMYIGGY